MMQAQVGQQKCVEFGVDGQTAGTMASQVQAVTMATETTEPSSCDLLAAN